MQGKENLQRKMNEDLGDLLKDDRKRKEWLLNQAWK